MPMELCKWGEKEIRTNEKFAISSIKPHTMRYRFENRLEAYAEKRQYTQLFRPAIQMHIEPALGRKALNRHFQKHDRAIQSWGQPEKNNRPNESEETWSDNNARGKSKGRAA